MIQELQLTKMKLLIDHAYNTVPFYRKRFRQEGIKPVEIKTLEDLTLLPTLTKEDVRKHGSELVSVVSYPRRMYRGRTGGSTGEPLQFYKDKSAKSWAWGTMQRFFEWSGKRLGESMITVTGQTDESEASLILHVRIFFKQSNFY